MNNALRTEEKGSFCVSFFKSIDDALPKYRKSILSVVVSIKKNRGRTAKYMDRRPINTR